MNRIVEKQKDTSGISEKQIKANARFSHLPGGSSGWRAAQKLLQLFSVRKIPFIFPNCVLDRCPSSMERSVVPVLEEHKRPVQCTDQPQQHIGQVHPDGIFQPLHTRITFRVLVNVHFREDSENGSPQYAGHPLVHAHHLYHMQWRAHKRIVSHPNAM